MQVGDIYFNNSLIVCIMHNDELFAYNKLRGEVYYETKKTKEFKDALYQYELSKGDDLEDDRRLLVETCFSFLKPENIYEAIHT